MEHLGMSDSDLYLAVAQTADNAILKSRQHPAGNFVEGRVCDGCNDGWMNELEKEGKSVLIGLIDGKVSLLNLAAEERATVAKWATKTAYVISYASPLKKTPEPSHLRYMEDNAGAVPPRVGVFARQGRATLDFIQILRNHWPQRTNFPPIRMSPEPGSYKTALQFRRLLLLVAYWPEEHTDFMLAASVHIPLWPQREIYFTHHVRFAPMNVQDPAARLEDFSRSLGVLDLRTGTET
jgi:hypothetical protein